eukprot:scaffold2534_cov364-Prasinococcus_capsulatus_cf.AAC.8
MWTGAYHITISSDARRASLGHAASRERRAMPCHAMPRRNTPYQFAKGAPSRSCGCECPPSPLPPPGPAHRNGRGTRAAAVERPRSKEWHLSSTSRPHVRRGPATCADPCSEEPQPSAGERDRWARWQLGDRHPYLKGHTCCVGEAP